MHTNFMQQTAVAFLWTAACATGLPGMGPASAADGAPSAATLLDNRWVYISHNFEYEKNVEEVLKVLERAAKAGYNGILITDCKFFRWNEMKAKGPSYENNVRKVRKACKDLGLKCIPCVLAASMDLLSNDPNLAEGMPVIDAPFVVKDGKLLEADGDLKIVNGSFDQAARENQPDGWSVDDPGKVTYVDTETKCEGRAAVRFQDVKNSSCTNGRANQKVTVKPFRYYHLSVKIKTDNFSAPGTVNIMALAPKQCLNYQRFDIAQTQDWKTYDVVFNTLDNTEAIIYVGSWGGQTGKIWFDDLKIEPGGFVNLVRRDGAPFKLTSADGKTVYEEGKDVAPVKDPKMGNTKWPGLYEYWYEQPVVTIPAGSRLKEGQTVLASYCHAMNTYGWGVFACLCEPKVRELYRWHLDNVNRVLEPDGYALPHDEIRHMGWDDSCRKAGLTPLQILMNDVKYDIELVRKQAPGKPMYIWSDMFDPHHNAHKKGVTDHLVRGIDPFHGAWEALDKDITILNWHGHPDKREESLKFFAERGHKQILAGFYDAPVEDVLPWLKEAVKAEGITGVMYTTWSNDFTKLESFLDTIKKFQAQQSK